MTRQIEMVGALFSTSAHALALFIHSDTHLRERERKSPKSIKYTVDTQSNESSHFHNINTYFGAKCVQRSNERVLQARIHAVHINIRMDLMVALHQHMRTPYTYTPGTIGTFNAINKLIKRNKHPPIYTHTFSLFGERGRHWNEDGFLLHLSYIYRLFGILIELK